MLSSKITTCRPSSTSRRARSLTISASWMWRAGASSKVEEKISASTLRRRSVTSSGRSSTSSMMTWLSGELARIDWAISLSRMVFPARGGATMSARCPRPSGVIKSTARAMSDFVTAFSRMIRSVGKVAVSVSNGFGCFHSCAGMPLDGLDLVDGQEFLPVPGRPHPPGQAVAGLQAKPADDGGRHVHILRARAGNCSGASAGSRATRRPFPAPHPRRPPCRRSVRKRRRSATDLVPGALRADADAQLLHARQQRRRGKGVQLVQVRSRRQAGRVRWRTDSRVKRGAGGSLLRGRRPPRPPGICQHVKKKKWPGAGPAPGAAPAPPSFQITKSARRIFSSSGSCAATIRAARGE